MDKKSPFLEKMSLPCVEEQVKENEHAATTTKFVGA
jgi:hypothetical protein